MSTLKIPTWITISQIWMRFNQQVIVVPNLFWAAILENIFLWLDHHEKNMGRVSQAHKSYLWKINMLENIYKLKKLPPPP